jgi:hypothetical protein
MAEQLKACCEQTLRQQRQRHEYLCTSYPIIKDFPCPVCKTILKLRVYEPPGVEQDGA